MKRIAYILAVAFAAFALQSCGKENNNGGNSGGGNAGGGSSTTTNITGEWHLTGLETKSINYSGVTVDVYVSFEKSGAFTLYQLVGEGRYTVHTGNYTLSKGVLSGTYTVGTTTKAWGSTYQVSVSGSTMTLSALSAEDGTTVVEVTTYKKESIPSSVKNNTY